MNINKANEQTHEIVSKINHACEDGDISWQQRQELVIIAVKEPEEAAQLLDAWKRPA